MFRGSILERLLFLLYINDMASVSGMLFIILFADDTNAFLNGRYVNKLVTIMNADLLNLKIVSIVTDFPWVYQKFISFCLMGKSVAHDSLLFVSNESIEQDQKTKLLGVTMEEKMTRCEHVQYI